VKLNNRLFIVIEYLFNIKIKKYDICKSIYFYPEETLFYWYSKNNLYRLNVYNIESDLYRLNGYNLESDLYYDINLMNKKNNYKFLSLTNRVYNYIKLINYNY
jgi:hypothetical protein